MFMSAEDGLSGIDRIVIDSLELLCMGCNDGTIHFVNNQQFKSTTRRDRYLERFKDKEKDLKKTTQSKMKLLLFSMLE